LQLIAFATFYSLFIYSFIYYGEVAHEYTRKQQNQTLKCKTEISLSA